MGAALHPAPTPDRPGGTRDLGCLAALLVVPGTVLIKSFLLRQFVDETAPIPSLSPAPLKYLFLLEETQGHVGVNFCGHVAGWSF